MCVVCFFSFSFSFLLIYIDPPRSLEEPSKNFRTTRRDYVSHLRYASFSSFCLLTSGDDRTTGIASTTNARKTHKLSEHHFYFSFPFLLLSCSLYLSLSSGCFPSSRYPEDFLRDITVDRDNERCTWRSCRVRLIVASIEPLPRDDRQQRSEMRKRDASIRSRYLFLVYERSDDRAPIIHVRVLSRRIISKISKVALECF